jgi:hypothetical protein
MGAGSDAHNNTSSTTPTRRSAGAIARTCEQLGQNSKNRYIGNFGHVHNGAPKNNRQIIIKTSTRTLILAYRGGLKNESNVVLIIAILHVVAGS